MLMVACNQSDKPEEDVSVKKPEEDSLINKADEQEGAPSDEELIPSDSIQQYMNLSIWNHKLQMEMPVQVVLLRNTRGNALFDLSELAGYAGIQRVRIDLHQLPCMQCTPDAHEVYQGYYEPGEYHLYDTVVQNQDTVYQEYISYEADTAGGIEHYYLTWLDGFHHKLVFHFYIYHSVQNKDDSFNHAVQRLRNVALDMLFSAVNNSQEHMHYPLIDLAVNLELNCILGGYSGNTWYAIDELLRVDTDFIYTRSGKDTLMSFNHFYCYGKQHYLFPAMAFVNQGNLQQYLEVHTNSPHLILNYGESPNHWLALTSSHDPFPDNSTPLVDYYSEPAEAVRKDTSVLRFFDEEMISGFSGVDMKVLISDIDADKLKDTLVWFAGRKRMQNADDPDEICAPGSAYIRQIRTDDGELIESTEISQQEKMCEKIHGMNVVDLNGDQQCEIVECNSKAYRQFQNVYTVQWGELKTVFSIEWGQ